MAHAVMREPPRPPGWPLIGHLPAFLHDKLGFLTRCAERYGDVVALRIGEPTYLLNDPVDIKHALIDNGSNYNRTWRMTSPRGKRIWGNGMQTSFGAEHLRKRRMVQPAFSRRSIGVLLPGMLDRTKQRIANWSDEPKEIDLASEMESLALSIILSALFGPDFVDDELRAAMVIRSRYVAYVYGSVLPFPEYLPVPIVRRYRRAQHFIDGVIRHEVDHPNSSQSFAGMFAAANPDGVRMDFPQLRDEILPLMSTFDSTGAALCWTLYLLALHPEAEAAVVKELSEVLGDRDPSPDDLAKLTFTRRVLDESLRLYPPNWILVRMAMGDDTLPSGTRIHRGTKLYLCQYVTHRSAKYFRDPNRFDPSRFGPTETAQRPEFAYFPFAGGQRRCIGEHFALVEGVTVLALLMRRYRFQLCPDQAIVPDPGVTLRPKYGIRARIFRR
jgi:cytochrome P450